MFNNLWVANLSDRLICALFCGNLCHTSSTEKNEHIVSYGGIDYFVDQINRWENEQ